MAKDSSFGLLPIIFSLFFISFFLSGCADTSSSSYTPTVLKEQFSVLGQYEQESDESFGLYYILRDQQGIPYMLSNCTQRSRPLLDSLYTAQGTLLSVDYCTCAFSKAGTSKVLRRSCFKSGKEQCINDTIEPRKTIHCSRPLARLQTE